MYKKIINIFFLFSFLAFMFLVSKYYFSEKNYIFTNKSRSSYTLLINEHGKSLPLLNEESDRLIPVEWDVGRSDIFNVRLKVESIDRKGMLREITEVISSSNINITSVDMKVKDALSTAFFIIQINNIKQLDRIINKVIKIPGVDNVERTGI